MSKYTIEIDEYAGTATLTAARKSGRRVMVLTNAKATMERETTEILDGPDVDGFRWVKNIPTGQFTFSLSGNMVLT